MKTGIGASVNLDLDSFDDEYLESCSTAKCPHCQHKVNLNVLLVEDAVFMLSSAEEEE